MADKDKEITSYNKEFLNLDFDDMSVEELERRLELSIASLDLELAACNGTFDCSGFTCGRVHSCGTF